MTYWAAYEKHKNAFWTAQEIDYAADLEDWAKLTDNERYFVEHILAFFAGADGIVLGKPGYLVSVKKFKFRKRDVFTAFRPRWKIFILKYIVF